MPGVFAFLSADLNAAERETATRLPEYGRAAYNGSERLTGPSVPRDARLGDVDTKADRRAEWQYRRFKGDYCERCGFIAIDPCQLDVHLHRESIENRVTLCANCHRLVTWLERRIGRPVTRDEITIVHQRWGTTAFDRQLATALRRFC